MVSFCDINPESFRRTTARRENSIVERMEPQGWELGYGNVGI